MADVDSAVADVKKYDSGVDEALVAAVFKGLGPAVHNKDASLVSCSDPAELDTVKKNFLIKKLGMTDGAELDAAIKEVCETLKETRQKSRVTFYYLLTKKFGKESVYA
ncbi:MAG: DUF2853 family protein [Cocleimonas sp.]